MKYFTSRRWQWVRIAQRSQQCLLPQRDRGILWDIPVNVMQALFSADTSPERSD